jgi:hypothetical protein
VITIAQAVVPAPVGEAERDRAFKDAMLNGTGTETATRIAAEVGVKSAEAAVVVVAGGAVLTPVGEAYAAWSPAGAKIVSIAGTSIGTAAGANMAYNYGSASYYAYQAGNVDDAVEYGSNAVVAGVFAADGAYNLGKIGLQAISVANAPNNVGSLRSRMGEPPAGMVKPQAHHDLPQKFAEKFEAKGIDINNPAYGRWVEGGPVGNHQKWGAAFNKEWERFFARFPEASREQILQEMQKLRVDPRFQ